MESLLLRRSLLFLVLHCGTSGWFGVSPVVRQKSCEEMRKGDVYVIGTEEEAGMGLDSCDQDWSSVSALENNSIQLAYFYNSTAEFMSPVVQLSQRKIVLDACVSIALHLECSKSLKSPKGNYAFLVCGLLVWLPFCSLLECCPWSHSTSSDRQALRNASEMMSGRSLLSQTRTFLNESVPDSSRDEILYNRATLKDLQGGQAQDT
ncbi:uncharacterized protein [Lepisosteus oculatus]|uniref:uncharacterized protein isoform X2 n=1 Tax=Lepisosteus oculatus TaxID=7918 RepID=UPI00370FE44F